LSTAALVTDVANGEFLRRVSVRLQVPGIAVAVEAVLNVIAVEDKRVNVLTVIPNESYEAFAKALQTEIEEETGVSFDNRVKNARAKARVRRKKLSAEEEALFKAIWQKISYQTRYSVKLETPELIKQCVDALADLNQYPKVQPAKIRALKAKIVMRKDGVHGVETGVGSSDAQTEQIVVPDVYAYIQNRVHLSRSSIFAILDGSGRLGELLINPQAFLDTAIAAIKNCLQALLVKGIEYHQINGRCYEMALFDEELETYLSSVYPPANDELTTPIHKTLLEAQPVDEGKNPLGDAFTCVLSESDPESQFAHDCSIDERVKFFFKLPGWEAIIRTGRWCLKTTPVFISSRKLSRARLRASEEARRT